MTRRGPLTAGALAWIATLSIDKLEELGRTADALEDLTLALAVVAEHARRFEDDVACGDSGIA